MQSASIYIKGTKSGTTSNQFGDFSLNIKKENKVLVISYVGFQSKEIEITNKDFINIKLKRLNTFFPVVTRTNCLSKKKKKHN